MPKLLWGSVTQARAGQLDRRRVVARAARGRGPRPRRRRWRSAPGSGRRQAEVAQLDQVAQPVDRAVVERAGQRAPGPGPLAADGVGGPGLVGSAGAQREQVDPGRQPLPRLEPGVAERRRAWCRGPRTTVPVSRRPLAEVDVDVDRARRRRSRRSAVRSSSFWRLRDHPRRAPACRGRRAAACRAAARRSSPPTGPGPASTSRSSRSPTCHTSSASRSIGIASLRPRRARAARETSSRCRAGRSAPGGRRTP